MTLFHCIMQRSSFRQTRIRKEQGSGNYLFQRSGRIALHSFSAYITDADGSSRRIFHFKDFVMSVETGWVD